MNTPDEIVSALRQTSGIAVTAHIRPDGDAIGACLGLHRILRDIGVESKVVGLGPIPDRYNFMFKDGECLSVEEVDFSKISLIAALDSGAIDRCHSFVAQQQNNVTLLNIDHHLSNTLFGDINYVDTKASSVGEIICEIARQANWNISRDAAEALWVSIVTDTGRFSYSNTTPATMRAASELLKTGIRVADINHAIYNSVHPRQLKLQGRAIDRLSVHEDGRLALTALSRADFSELGCTPADTEEIVNIPRSIAGVEVAVFLYELEDKSETKISLRTAEPYDAAELCRRLGGGGHARAAGCSMPGTIETVYPEIIGIIHRKWFQA